MSYQDQNVRAHLKHWDYSETLKGNNCTQNSSRVCVCSFDVFVFEVCIIGMLLQGLDESPVSDAKGLTKSQSIMGVVQKVHNGMTVASWSCTQSQKQSKY